MTYFDFFTRQSDDDVSNNSHDIGSADIELTKKILDLEIKAMKSSGKIKSLEQKLEQRTKERDSARNMIAHSKSLYEKEKKADGLFKSIKCKLLNA